MSDSLRKITVLMTVYNGSQYLQNSISSILNQTFDEFEFLIIDDGSTDNSEEIINNIKDSRINYKRISHRGLASVLNYGLGISSGDYIARMDCDDVCGPLRLEKQIGFLKSNPEVDVLSSWSVYFKDKDKILFTVRPPCHDSEIKKFLNLHNPVNHSSVTFLKDKIIKEGGYNELFESYEDFELWFRLKDKLNFAILPEFLVFTRLHKGSLTRRGSKHKIYEMLSSNAIDKFDKSSAENERKFWNNILFWIEYFYGEKDRSRVYFAGDVTIKKSIAYLSTFFPPNAFKEILEYRIRQRIQTNFKGKSELKNQLEQLIN